MFDDNDINEEENIITFDETEDLYYEEISENEEDTVVGGASYGIGNYYYKEISTRPPKSLNGYRPRLCVRKNGGPMSIVVFADYKVTSGWEFRVNNECSKITVKRFIDKVGQKSETMALYWDVGYNNYKYIATVKF